jgi:hypothetical protein
MLRLLKYSWSSFAFKAGLETQRASLEIQSRRVSLRRRFLCYTVTFYGNAFSFHIRLVALQLHLVFRCDAFHSSGPPRRPDGGANDPVIVTCYGFRLSVTRPPHGSEARSAPTVPLLLKLECHV